MTATIATARMLPNRNYGFDYKLNLEFEKGNIWYVELLEKDRGDGWRSVKIWDADDLKDALRKFSKIVVQDREGEPFWR